MCETKKSQPVGCDFFKLGYKDSNLEMTESESVALPFGDTPLVSFVAHKTLLYTFQNKNQEEIKKNIKKDTIMEKDGVYYNHG